MEIYKCDCGCEEFRDFGNDNPDKVACHSCGKIHSLADMGQEVTNA